jgi:hypothetical protein
MFCKKYVDVNKPDILVIMETRVGLEKLRKMFSLLEFDGYDFTKVREIVVAWKRDNECSDFA